MKNCLGIEIGNYRIKIAYMERRAEGVYFRTDRRRSETGCQTLRGDDPGSSGSKNDPLQCRVFVKQLNQKLNYFTVSVKRGW